MHFDHGKTTVPVENRSVALGACRLRLAIEFEFFGLFANNVQTGLVRSECERH